MTTFQSEIARIIAGFSAVEREKFARMGGILPIVSAPEPKWWIPGDPLCGFQVQRHPTTVMLQLDGVGSYSYREVAELLNVKEATVRSAIRAGECIVRGVKVKRIAREAA